MRFLVTGAAGKRSEMPSCWRETVWWMIESGHA